MLPRRFPADCYVRLTAFALGTSLLLSWTFRGVAAEEPPRKPAARDRLPGRLFVLSSSTGVRGETTLAFDLNDETWVKIASGLPPVRVSPDGGSILYATMPRGPKRLRTIEIAEAQGERPAVPILELENRKYSTSPFWSARGRLVYVVEAEARGNTQNFITWEVASDGSHPIKLPLPVTEQVQDISPDGQWFVTLSTRPAPGQGKEPDGSPQAVCLIHRDGTGERRLFELASDPKSPTSTRGYRFSPDGRTIAYIELKRDRGDGGIVSGSLRLVGIDGKDRRSIREGTAERFPVAVCWSPDGKWLAVSTWEKPADAGPGSVNLFNGKTVVEVIDREGRTERTVDLPPAQHHMVLDWR